MDNIRDFSREFLAEYDKIRTDPWHFLTTCVFTKDQVDKNNPIKRFPADWDYLRLYCRIWQKYKLIAVPKSRRMTMSWTNIALYLWDTMFNPHREQAFVSKKEDDAAELVRRAEFIYDHIPEDKIPRRLLPKKETRAKPAALIFPELDSKIQGFPMGADQLRQFTFSGILGDECAFWEEAQAFYSAAFPTIEGGGRMSLISSRSPGFFQRLVYDQLDNTDDIEEENYPATPKHPMGDDSVMFWINPKNKFAIFDLHYTANPNKRGAGFKDKVKSSMPIKDFMVEYERNWDAFEGKPVYEDYSKIRHEVRRAELPELGLPLLCGWDFGLCYDDKTEVLTENGWKLFKNVDKAEKVATLNPESFDLEYEVPKLHVDMPYTGEMHVWDSHNLQAAITPDHIVPLFSESGQFRRKYAKDLKDSSTHDKIRMTAYWQGKDALNPLDMSALTFAKFMGAYLSEGSTDKNRTTIYQVKNCQWVEDILLSTNYQWTRIDEGYRTRNDHLSGYLKQFGISKEKFIPNEIKNGTKETIAAFIESYTMGDGHIRERENGSEEHTIFTTSKRMADDLSELALKVGWFSSISERKPQSSFYSKEERFIESSGGYVVTFKKGYDYSEIRSAKKTTIQYSGRVYCLSVTHGTLYVRKNGRPHWNGNTPACVVAQLRDGRLHILREFVAEHASIKRFCPQVMTSLRQYYPEWTDMKKDFRHYIDPAGLAENQVDSRTCAQEMASAGLKNIFPGAIDWESRRKAVEHFLLLHTKDGAGIQLYAPHCPMLSKGFAGGYRYPEKYQQIEPGKPRPIKDKFSHCHDSLQYLATGAISLMTKKPVGELPTPSYSFTQTENKETRRAL